VTTARWLAALGVTAFVVQYRAGPARATGRCCTTPGAVRVRSPRRRVGVTARVGVVGFSAGGHCASTAPAQCTSTPAGPPTPTRRARELTASGWRESAWASVLKKTTLAVSMVSHRVLCLTVLTMD
jgi:hypothetical protein